MLTLFDCWLEVVGLAAFWTHFYELLESFPRMFLTFFSLDFEETFFFKESFFSSEILRASILYFSFSYWKNTVDLGLVTLSLGECRAAYTICCSSSSLTGPSKWLTSFTSTLYIFSLVVKFSFPLLIFHFVTLYSFHGFTRSLMFSIHSSSENADHPLVILGK